MEVNSENIEMWIMMLVDDELSPEETERVWNYMEQYPEYMDTYAALGETKIPAVDISYPDIDTLLQQETGTARIAPVTRKTIPFRYAGRIAAAVVLLTGIGWYGFYGETESRDRSPIAARPTLPRHNKPSGLPTDTDIVPGQTAVPVDGNRGAAKQADVVVLAGKHNVIDVSGQKGETVAAVIPEEMARIRPVKSKIKRTPEQLIAAEIHMLPAGVSEERPAEAIKRNILPVTASLEQKGLLEDIGREVQEKMDIVKDVYQIAKNSTIQINIGNKSFTIKK